MKNGNLAEELITGTGEDASRCLCIPCAVSEKDFKERVAESGGLWDGSSSPRAWINGRAYNLLYSPASCKAYCEKCGQEIYWAYHPETAELPDRVPAYMTRRNIPAKPDPTCSTGRGMRDAVDLHRSATRLALLLREATLDAVLIQSWHTDISGRIIKAGVQSSPFSPHLSFETVEKTIADVLRGVETLRQCIRQMEEQTRGLEDLARNPENSTNENGHHE